MLNNGISISEIVSIVIAAASAFTGAVALFISIKAYRHERPKIETRSSEPEVSLKYGCGIYTDSLIPISVNLEYNLVCFNSSLTHNVMVKQMLAYMKHNKIIPYRKSYFDVFEKEKSSAEKIIKANSPRTFSVHYTAFATYNEKTEEVIFLNDLRLEIPLKIKIKFTIGKVTFPLKLDTQKVKNKILKLYHPPTVEKMKKDGDLRHSSNQ